MTDPDCHPWHPDCAETRIADLTAERDAAEAELEQCEWERRAAVAELAYLKGRLRAAEAKVEAKVNPDALADALDDLASDATLGSFPVGNYDRGAGVLRAAAARLRQHHALLHAIGDPDEFTAEAESWLAYVPVHFMEKWDAAAWVDQVHRIADAVQPPDPTPPPTLAFVCRVCDEWASGGEGQNVCDSCAPLIHDMHADPSPPPRLCPTCATDCEQRGRCSDPWHLHDLPTEVRRLSRMIEQDQP